MKSYAVFPIAVLIICAVAFASAVELPAQKPGVWETTMKGTGIPGGSRSLSMCIDAATQVEAKATMKKNCSKNEARKEGNGWVNDSVCTVAGAHVISHSVVTPTNGDTAFRTEITTTYDPPMMGKTSSAMTIDSKWLGACQPGQKPGVPMRGR